jgi:hypothetical protein
MTFKDLLIGETFYFAHDPRRCICTKVTHVGSQYRVELSGGCFYGADDETISVVVWLPHQSGDRPPHANE